MIHLAGIYDTHHQGLQISAGRQAIFAEARSEISCLAVPASVLQAFGLDLFCSRDSWLYSVGGRILHDSSAGKCKRIACGHRIGT